MTEKKDNNGSLNEKSGQIVLKNITKRFGSTKVLKRVSLAVEKGKTTVVIGPSGCGKTVLLKHMIGLLRPSSGEVYYDGQRIDRIDEQKLHSIRVKFGYLFQSGALFDSLTVGENILFPIKQFYGKIKTADIKKIVQSKLAMVGLDGYQNRYPAELSGGQQKRVALARAIALNPEVILYDEPTTGLDPVRSDIINELILKLKEELGITSVAVTHDMVSAYKIADRVIMLHNGIIRADGTPCHIRNHPDRIVQNFINGWAADEDLDELRNHNSKDAVELPLFDSKPK